MKTGAIFFAQRDRALILKFVGAIRIASREANRLSAAFESLVRRLPEMPQVDQVLIDLTEAVAIDSTHLGLLAQVAQFTLARWSRRPTILSTNDDINTILASVGFDEVFQITGTLPPLDGHLESLEPAEASQWDEAQMILMAHRALAKINLTNEEQFRNVIELLDEELRNRSPELPPSPSSRP